MSIESSETVVYRSYCPQCGSLCAMKCYVQDGKLVKVEPDPEHPSGGALCPKGRACLELIYSPHRLRWPLRRTRPKGDPDPGWQRVSWEEALGLAAERLLQIREESGAEAVAFYRGAKGGTPSTDYEPFLIRLASAFGSPNNMSTGHICNWHRDSGSKYTLGTGLPEPDFEHSAAILIWGANPTRTCLNMHRSIRRGLLKGARLVVVDPRRTELAERAQVWLQVRPGSDGALALALLHLFIKEEYYQEDFVRDWTNAPFLVWEESGRLVRPVELGLPGGDYVVWDGGPVSYDPSSLSLAREEARPVLEGRWELDLPGGGRKGATTAWELLKKAVEPYTPARAAELTWVPEESLRKAAELLGKTRPLSFYSYNGIEQSTVAMQTNRALNILYALTGCLGQKGGNLDFPKAPSHSLEGRELLPPGQKSKRLGVAKRPLGAAATRVQAYEFYRAVLEHDPYPVRALVSLGGNIASANGDSLTGRKALQKLDFFLNSDLFMTPTAELADLVLPASTPWEGWYVRAGFGKSGPASCHLQVRPKVIEPLSESLPDPEIILRLALRLGLGEHFWGGDLEKAFRYFLEPSGVTLEELQANPGGLTLSLPARYDKYKEKDQNGHPRGLDTPSGRVEIFCETFDQHGYPPLPYYEEPPLSPYRAPDLYREFPLVLTNTKLKEYCHGQHRGLPSLRRRQPHPFVEVHPDTAREMGIADGEWVRLETPVHSIRLMARWSDRVAPGVACAQHGWWQGCPELGLPAYDPFSPEGANINLTISNEIIDPISGSVPHKGTLCRLVKLG